MNTTAEDLLDLRPLRAYATALRASALALRAQGRLLAQQSNALVGRYSALNVRPPPAATRDSRADRVGVHPFPPVTAPLRSGFWFWVSDDVNADEVARSIALRRAAFPTTSSPHG